MGFHFHFCLFVNKLCAGGEIIDVKLESPSIAKNKVGISSTRLINIYLPTGYGKSNLRYPTIYWIGGYTDKSLYNYPKMLDDAIQNYKIAPVIVVFINTPEGTFFVNSDITGYWEDFLVKELLPYIDSNYLTIPNMDKRGIGGHTTGGSAAILLPLWYPGIWGAVGTNDAAIWTPWDHILDADEIPETLAAIKKDFSFWASNYRTTFFNNILTSVIDDYPKKDNETRFLWEIASRITPNLSNPNGVDLPITADGKWIPEIKEKWRDFCILESKTIEKYRKELSQLSLNITVVSKDFFKSAGYENEYFVELLKSAGIPVNRMEMPGFYMDYINERFIALVEVMLGNLNVVSVDSKDKVATTWGSIKNNK